MIKILHFLTDTNIGGAGNLLIQQISRMDNKEFDFTVALPKGSKLINKLPCKIIECKYGADRSLSIKSIIESTKIIKSSKPDIVHSHGSLSSRIAATLLNIPCRVFTRHCAPAIPKYMKNSFAKRCFGKTNSILSSSIIAVSPYTKMHLIELGCDENKITTVMNGCAPLRRLNEDEKLDLRQKYGLENDTFVISIVARLEKGKGHSTLIESAKICKDKYPNFHFLIVGTGSFEENLRDYANKLCIESIVHFTGFCDDIATIFNITDVNVNCSYESETASLSICEGMSLGIPTVASNIGGNPYMVKSGENGLIFPAQNSNALADALIRLYTDKALYKKCSLGAQMRYSAELNGEIMCKKMKDFYLREYAENYKK